MADLDVLISSYIIALALLIATPTLIFWDWLSDKIGWKPIILGGMLLAGCSSYLRNGPTSLSSESSMVSWRSRQSPAIYFQGVFMRIKAFSVLAIIMLFISNGVALSATAEKTTPEKTKNNQIVKDGMMVSLEFTLKNPEGKVIETSKGGEPLKYVHGQKMMIPGLEKELTGMKVGGEKHVTVKPEDGYGKINPKAVKEFPKEKIPANALKVGAVLATQNPEGMVVPMTVREIKEKTVVMDMNHPMAGKTLVFDVKVVDIQPAPPPPQAQPAKPAAPAKPPAPAKPVEPAKK